MRRPQPQHSPLADLASLCDGVPARRHESCLKPHSCSSFKSACGDARATSRTFRAAQDHLEDGRGSPGPLSAYELSPCAGPGHTLPKDGDASGNGRDVQVLRPACLAGPLLPLGRMSCVQLGLQHPVRRLPIDAQKPSLCSTHTCVSTCTLSAVLPLQPQLAMRLKSAGPAAEHEDEPTPRRTARKRMAVIRLDPVPERRSTTHAAAASDGLQRKGRRAQGLPQLDQPRPALRCRFCAAHGECVVSSPAHRASCWYYNSCACSACDKVHRRNLAVAKSQRRRRAAEAALTL